MSGSSSSAEGSSAGNRRSRLAAVAFATGVAGVVVALGGVGAVQLGLISPMWAFGFFVAGTLLLGAVAMTTGAISILRTWSRFGPEDRRRSLSGTLLGMALVAIVLVAAGGGRGKPPINDVTTDLENPPDFASASEVPDYAGRDMTYPDAFAPIVRKAYPKLEPIHVSAPPDEAYARALASAEALGWQVVHEDPEEKTFTATDTSAVFRFVDDVTIRIRSAEWDGTRIDVRSKSRVGRGDLGANAERIQRFAAEMKLPPVASPEKP